MTEGFFLSFLFSDVDSGLQQPSLETVGMETRNMHKNVEGKKKYNRGRAKGNHKGYTATDHRLSQPCGQQIYGLSLGVTCSYLLGQPQNLQEYIC